MREVYSPGRKSAKELVKRLYNASISNSLDFSDSNCNWFILATPDSAIEEVAREIALPDNSLIIHTSGSTPIEILNYSAAEELGVFYPFQSFTKGKKLDLKSVPILIEGSSKDVERKLSAPGKKISSKVLLCNSADRAYLHLAGVFASNFTNHMITRGQDIAQQHGFSRELLYPLIAETINKALQIGSENAQTGPARRQDVPTLEHHIKMLEEYEGLQEIYDLLSKDILNKYEGNNGE